MRFPRTSSPFKRSLEIFGDPVIVHSDYMSDPTPRISLLWQFEHAEDCSSLEGSVFGDFVLPVDVRDVLSFRACRVGNAQDTLLYRRVLKTQAL